VVDDGSEDDSWNIAFQFGQKDSRFRIYRRPETLPKGANSCRNFGADIAAGDYLVFLDADDLLAKDALQYRLQKLPQEVNFGVFRTAIFSENIDQSIPFSSLGKKKYPPEHFLKLFLGYRIPWHTSSVVWQKSFFWKTGGFDIELQRFQDVELHIRALANAGLKMWIDPSQKFTSYYRKSTFHQQVTLNQRRFLLNQGFLFLEKLKLNLGNAVIPNTSGIGVYLAFRFEEVISNPELDRLVDYYRKDLSDCKPSLQFIIKLHQAWTRPSRVRKILAYLIYRTYLFGV